MSGPHIPSSRRLDWAERWIRDGLDLTRPPAFFQSVLADMTAAQAAIEEAKAAGERITYAAVLVRAAAVALDRHRDLHVAVCGGRKYQPRRVDVALSVAAEEALAPVLLIEGAGTKTLREITNEIAARAEEVRQSDARFMAGLRRWGRLAPFSFLRRAILRLAGRSYELRRKGAGTIQVSIAPGVDQFWTPIFNGTAILTAGRVAPRVIALDGAAVVRPTMHLGCAADHRVWDGSAAQRFLTAVRAVVESGSFE